jgi:hypothetical protein
LQISSRPATTEVLTVSCRPLSRTALCRASFGASIAWIEPSNIGTVSMLPAAAAKPGVDLTRFGASAP